ncbi:MAG: HEAT repeat domain-containing protein, partial [Ignavibacteriaceae bacterium]|nr:HEAT repeat domain-containing protein [Ignavibacteriaceae bacterium]
MIKQIVIASSVFIITFSNLFSQETTQTSAEKIKSLIEKFSDEDPFINGEAIDELAKIKEPAVEYLVKSLQDENENIRLCSAIALEKISPSGKQAIPFLTNALKDKSPNVRWCSAITLGKYKSDAESSITELQKLLYDEDYDVCWAAYISLNKIDKNSLNIVPEFYDVLDKIENITPQLMNELNVPGVSISVIKSNKLAGSKSFGIADTDLKIPVTGQTMFEA